MNHLLRAGIIGALLLLPAVARADDPRGPFGLGVQIGEPTGISGKLWMSRTTAWDGVVAWSFADEGALHLQADFLWHFFPFEVDTGELPLYVGVGGRIKFYDDASRAGVRIPLGITYLFSDAPIDVYLEVAPIIDFSPETEVRSNGGLGIRYYFH